MTPRADHDLHRLAATQGNLFTMNQATGLGMPRSTVVDRRRIGRYETVAGTTGVLRVSGAAAAPDEDAWRALLQVGGDDVAVARHTAARLHGLRPAPRSDVVHLVVHDRSFLTPPAGVLVHRSEHVVERWDVTVVRGMRCTSVARTLCDLAREVPPTLLVALVNDAVRRGLTDIIELRQMAARLGRFRWKTRLLGILDELSPHAEDAANATESRFIELCEEHGLPLLGINVAMRDDDGVQRYVDALLRREDGRHIPVEVDGHETHWTRIDRGLDAQRERRLLAGNPRLVPFVRIRADEVWHDPTAAMHRLKSAVDCAVLYE